MVRREVFYFGNVQGVGFRYTARQIAERFEVTGYGKNMVDGSVQVVAEGDMDEVENFITEIGEEMSRHIRSIDVRVGGATGEFDDFSVLT